MVKLLNLNLGQHYSMAKLLNLNLGQHYSMVKLLNLNLGQHYSMVKLDLFSMVPGKHWSPSIKRWDFWFKSCSWSGRLRSVCHHVQADVLLVYHNRGFMKRLNGLNGICDSTLSIFTRTTSKTQLNLVHKMLNPAILLLWKWVTCETKEVEMNNSYTTDAKNEFQLLTAWKFSEVTV